MKKLTIGIATLAALMGAPALAADMAVKARPAPSPVYSWTGCYLGGNLGGGRAHTQFTFNGFVPSENEGSLNSSGLVGGGQVGCDYQFASNFVIGVQGMFDGTAIKGIAVDPNNDGDSYPTTLHWFGTVTGRLGFLVTPSVLAYGKGGVAWVHERLDYDFPTPGVFSATAGNVTRTGWDAGAGLEWRFAPRWSVFVEYNHMDFGTKDFFYAVPPGAPGGFTESVKQSVDTVLVGVNWRFN